MLRTLEKIFAINQPNYKKSFSMLLILRISFQIKIKASVELVWALITLSFCQFFHIFCSAYLNMIKRIAGTDTVIVNKSLPL